MICGRPIKKPVVVHALLLRPCELLRRIANPTIRKLALSTLRFFSTIDMCSLAASRNFRWVRTGTRAPNCRSKSALSRASGMIDGWRSCAHFCNDDWTNHAICNILHEAGERYGNMLQSYPPKAQTPINAQVTNTAHFFVAVWRAAFARRRAEGASAWPLLAHA